MAAICPQIFLQQEVCFWIVRNVAYFSVFRMAWWWIETRRPPPPDHHTLELWFYSIQKRFLLVWHIYAIVATINLPAFSENEYWDRFGIDDDYACKLFMHSSSWSSLKMESSSSLRYWWSSSLLSSDDMIDWCIFIIYCADQTISTCSLSIILSTFT